ncbi:hypothetical protein KPH14_005204 [Odynerus spinipes]|uniref:Laccase n=1 Tax=Odynerus spinipes TaxID=1348599 RepID=A0AAD9VPR0_9HYME|nr:hypothetical protein KPH14_005204 [Odynerus spinipes]
MPGTKSNMLFLLISLIIFTRVGVYCNNSSETTEPAIRLARATGQVRLSTPEECYRPCDGAAPRYCYYRFQLEYYTTMGPACNQCRTDSFARSKNQSSCQCILADGVEKTIFSINRQFPGPSIQVCQYDKLIVDVENAAEGLDTTIHWHGIFQNTFQYYDGVPHLTQCPISAPNTFRYQFSADNSGTHFYHSHSSLFMIDGQQGPLIVRSPKSTDVNGRLYDFDLFDHVIFLSDWLHTLALDLYPGRYAMRPGQFPDNFLINGHGDWTDPSTGRKTNVSLPFFRVYSGKRYRFRMINSFGTVCPAEITIQNHRMTVIATDGEDVKPTVVDRIVSTSGERYDFVLNANQNGGSYWIQVRGLAECAEKKILQVGVLIYGDQLALPRTARPTFDKPLTGNVVLNSLNAAQCMNTQVSNEICVNQLKYGKPTPQEERKTYPDLRLYIPFNFFTYDEKILTQNQYNPFYIAIDRSMNAAMVSNISYSEPPAPPISQYEGYEKLCTVDRVPTCTKPCLCTHVINLPKQVLVEIVLCDQDPFVTLHHPFHLHGYSFQVMAIKDYGGRKPNQSEIYQLVRDHDNNLASGKYDQKPRKDTIKVPVGGCVILRFYTNNPGWWLFHCHFLWHTMAGMNVVVHVGEESDMPAVPNGFPTCGNYVPPVYI